MHKFNSLFVKVVHMRTGKDGEYYFIEIDREELEKLKELVAKKIKEKRPPEAQSSK